MQELDQQMKVQVAKAKEDFAAFQDVMHNADKSMKELGKISSHHDFVSLVDKTIGMKAKLSQLPQSASSGHHIFVSESLKAIDEDCLPQPIDRNEKWMVKSMIPDSINDYGDYDYDLRLWWTLMNEIPSLTAPDDDY